MVVPSRILLLSATDTRSIHGRPSRTIESQRVHLPARVARVKAADSRTKWLTSIVYLVNNLRRRNKIHTALAPVSREKQCVQIWACGLFTQRVDRHVSLVRVAELHPNIPVELFLTELAPPFMRQEQQRDIDFWHTPSQFLAELA